MDGDRSPPPPDPYEQHCRMRRLPCDMTQSVDAETVQYQRPRKAPRNKGDRAHFWKVPPSAITPQSQCSCGLQRFRGADDEPSKQSRQRVVDGCEPVTAQGEQRQYVAPRTAGKQGRLVDGHSYREWPVSFYPFPLIRWLRRTAPACAGSRPRAYAATARTRVLANEQGPTTGGPGRHRPLRRSRSGDRPA